MQMTPLIAVHMTAALTAIAIGPVALWARKGATQRPKLHRAFGYAWVTLMLVTAISAIFIRDTRLPNINGFTPIHILVPVTLSYLFRSFWALAHGDVASHRKLMQRLYYGACIAAGAFTLMPGRYLGNLVLGQWLGLISPNYQPPQGTPMIAQILINTPVWVWGLLAALLALGFSQTRTRIVGLSRLVLMPLGLGAFSVWGTVSAFGASPAVLGSWLAATIVLLLVVTQFRVPAGVKYDSALRQFNVPGSWVPMVLIVGIFLTKYVVGVSLAMHPELRANANFVLAIATLYGVFSGIFAGRTARLLRLALRPASSPVVPALNA